MSDTPTFASLLTQWASGGPAARAVVYAHLRAHPAEAAALEASIRDEIKTGYPWKRVLAAEALVEVYRDEPAAVAALGGVLRMGDESAASDAAPVLQKLSAEAAGALLADFAHHAPAAFRMQSAAFHRFAGSAAIRAGATGAELWLALLGHAGEKAEPAYFMGLAEGAPRTTHDASAVEPAVRQRLFHNGSGYAAGAALWRLTWRVHRDWLASINPHTPWLEGDPALHVLLIEVLTEHLGRRPDLAPIVRELLVRLGNAAPDRFARVMKRLANLGRRGWAVLLPVLGDAGVPAHTRAAVFHEAASRPAVLPLARHHAHGVVLARAQNRAAIPPELLQGAATVFRAIGAPAAPALPDVLDLMVKQPETAAHLAPAAAALADGWVTPGPALARALDRMRRSSTFAPDAFAALAEVLAARCPDAAPALVEDASFDPRTADSLLQHLAWKNAPADVRRRHAGVLADRLADPRSVVRVRAAKLLGHYPDQMPAVWPALVAALACGDEPAVLLALPQFDHLAPVADAVAPELVALFREPNPTYAARAVVALRRLGRLAGVAGELRATVIASADERRGWAVLRGAVDREQRAHGLLHDLAAVFAGAPPEVAAKVHALLSLPEEPEEAARALRTR